MEHLKDLAKTAAFVFLFLNGCATILRVGVQDYLWKISPYLHGAYLLALAVSMYGLRSLWLALWRTLRSDLRSLRHTFHLPKQ